MTENNVSSTQEDLQLAQKSVIENNKDFIKLGLSQIQGSELITLKEEGERLKKEAKKSRGTICKCCGQKVQLYKRTLTAEMCVCILSMLNYYRHSENAELYQYYTKHDFFMDIINDKTTKYIINDFTKLKYWDIIAPMPTHPTKIKYKKGYWSLTENGIKFAQREIGLPRYAFIYNDQVDSHSGGKDEFVTIDTVLKEGGLDYDKLMK